MSSTITSAEAPYIATKVLYDDIPSTLITSLVEDDSSEGFIDITGKLQIVSGDHAVVLDFSCYFDQDNGQGTLTEELLAVDRLLEEVLQFRRQFYAAVRNAQQDS